MSKPRICVILVNYNGYDDTVECVKSLVACTGPSLRVIMVENGSGDRARVQADTFLNAHADLVISEQNLGFAGGNNLGVAYALRTYSPEWVLLLNNDTAVEPDMPAKLIAAAQANPGAGIVTGKILYYAQRDVLWAGRGKFSFKTGIADQPAMGRKDEGQEDLRGEITFASGCVMLIPAKVWRTVGPLDDSYFMYAEDTDYCCRVLQAGYSIYYEPAAVTYHKVSAAAGAGSKRQQYYMFRNNCRIVQKYCRYPLYGYLRRFYRTAKEMRRGAWDKAVVKHAWKDFRKGITGKAEM